MTQLYNNKTVRISWDASTTPGINGFAIWKSPIPYGTFTLVTTVDSNTTYYTDTITLIPYGEWFYYVTEYVSAGPSYGPRPTYGTTYINPLAWSQDPFTDQSPYFYFDNTDMSFYLEEIRRRNLALLEQDGEPFKLLKRRYSGTPCPLLRSEAGTQCPNPLGKPIGTSACYGTGYLGGYYDTLDIKIRVGLATNAVTQQSEGFRISDKPKMWTIYAPSIVTGDLLVSQENFRYEVINVLQTKARGMILHQEMEVQRLDMSDIKMKVPITLVD